MKKIISTNKAPAAIGTYSQAVVHNQTLYISGQIPLDPTSMEMVSDDIEAQIEQVFKNLNAVCSAANANLNDVLKFNVYLTNLDHFPLVNEAMSRVLTDLILPAPLSRSAHCRKVHKSKWMRLSPSPSNGR